MKLVHAVLSIYALVALGGCASVPNANLANRAITPEMVQRIVRDNRERVHTLKGSGTITVETPDMAQSGSFDLLLHKPDSMLVQVQGPFGLHVGSVLLTRTDFLFYNSLKNQLITGTVNASNLNRIFRINLTFDELLSLFTGGSFFAGDIDASDSLMVEDNQFVLMHRNDAGSRRYWIDPTSLLITKIEHLDLNGELFFEERFENFRALGQTYLPRYVRLTQQLTRRVVAVSFSSFAINTGGVPLSLDVPTNAERVRWQ